MKCLPSNKLDLACGNALHDWHAEVLAIRTFNRFLLDECLSLTAPPHRPSKYVRQRSAGERTQAEHQPFAIRDDVQIHMYCSEAPCGDASMELVMDAQEDATPWTTPLRTVSSPTEEVDPALLPEEPAGAGTRAPPELQEANPIATALRGRSHFGHLGAVRCKPSRPDAPPTLSKSCSDKLALTQATSLLSSMTSLLVSPHNAYIHSLVLPTSQFIPSACERAFSRSGRMSPITPQIERNWEGGYRWHEFKVHGTSKEFAWSRRNVSAAQKAMASNLSAVWTPHWEESLIGGVLQGRKQFDPRGASRVCRRSLWKIGADIAAVAAIPALTEAIRRGAYGEVKAGAMLGARRKVKDEVKARSLKGWIKNSGDDFSL
ncbi:hypothetical protein BS50DRAFT_351607 [Corynespora cassiicola Philippines]|uniref:A to I editase domain-containing protein n=1 Tax=Corynespora cassiicola Philippines TaxID=1448308 RepID=A0A2T2NR80_CORCC|nr:hypothetical protein BS50DRAFT_351607 [Corynespora cassiicola Philippines]